MKVTTLKEFKSLLQKYFEFRSLVEAGFNTGVNFQSTAQDQIIDTRPVPNGGGRVYQLAVKPDGRWAVNYAAQAGATDMYGNPQSGSIREKYFNSEQEARAFWNTQFTPWDVT